MAKKTLTTSPALAVCVWKRKKNMIVSGTVSTANMEGVYLHHG